MGLDATVRCRCFEEGKLEPGPVPAEDLYVDEEGYLSSRKLDEAFKKFDYRRYEARYGLLEDEFFEWSRNCCEHEDGDYLAEWISNWSGCGEFGSLVEEAGGEEKFPLLSNLLPDGNGGIYPAEKAAATLAELDRFIEVVTDVSWQIQTGNEIDGEAPFLYKGKYWTAERIRNLLVASVETGNPIRWC